VLATPVLVCTANNRRRAGGHPNPTSVPPRFSTVVQLLPPARQFGRPVAMLNSPAEATTETCRNLGSAQGLGKVAFHQFSNRIGSARHSPICRGPGGAPRQRGVGCAAIPPIGIRTAPAPLVSARLAGIDVGERRRPSPGSCGARPIRLPARWQSDTWPAGTLMLLPCRRPSARLCAFTRNVRSTERRTRA